MRKRLFLFFCAIAALSEPLPANAEDVASARPTVQWRCWYDQNVHIVCLMEGLAQPSELAASVGGYAPSANLPPFVHALRKTPEAFRRETIRIPLHGHARDMAFTETLARAGVCGARPSCSVRFSATAPSAVELAGILDWQREEADEMLAWRTGTAPGELR